MLVAQMADFLVNRGSSKSGPKLSGLLSVEIADCQTQPICWIKTETSQVKFYHCVIQCDISAINDLNVWLRHRTKALAPSVEQKVTHSFHIIAGQNQTQKTPINKIYMYRNITVATHFGSSLTSMCHKSDKFIR